MAKISQLLLQSSPFCDVVGDPGYAFKKDKFRIFIILGSKALSNIQKQTSKGVLRKRCSGNIQQIYRRKPMPKCDLSKVAATLLKSYFGMCILQ